MEETSPKRERRVATAETDQAPAGTDLTGDWGNVLLLLLLYMMQGLPLGISTAVPVLLKSNTDVSYRELVSEPRDRRTTGSAEPRRETPGDCEKARKTMEWRDLEECARCTLCGCGT